MKRVRKKKRSPARLLMTLLLVCVLLFCVVKVAGILWEGYQVDQENASVASRYILDITITRPVASEEESEATAEEDEEEEEEEVILVENPVDFAALQADSPYAVGWIQVSGLDIINYPLVWNGDNSFFLTHTWEGVYSRYGAIFLDENNAVDFSDCYNIIYGHNMKNGSMFGSLKKYVNESFYQENGGEITICLPGEIRIYQLFCVRYATPTDEGVYTLGFAHDEVYGEFLRALASSSLYDTGVSVTQEDEVIVLSTCSGSTRRLVLCAKLTERILTY